MDTTAKNAAFTPRSSEEPETDPSPDHVHHQRVRCVTDPIGHATPHGRSVLDIVVDASGGFIPLWDKDTTLRWRFKPKTLRYFKDPHAAGKQIRKLIGEALVHWSPALPVKFKEDNDTWDFQVTIRKGNDCDASGCVLASSFFPDSGRHDLLLYPKMFEEDAQEQLDTVIHELGHVFGLRHFFAKLSEAQWPSEVFGKHSKFSIMNYGADSRLTAADKADLARLYKLAWSGELTKINGTPIRFMKPYHASGTTPPQGAFAPALEAALRNPA